MPQRTIWQWNRRVIIPTWATTMRGNWASHSPKAVYSCRVWARLHRLTKHSRYSNEMSTTNSCSMRMRTTCSIIIRVDKVPLQWATQQDRKGLSTLTRGWPSLLRYLLTSQEYQRNHLSNQAKCLMHNLRKLRREWLDWEVELEVQREDQVIHRTKEA